MACVIATQVSEHPLRTISQAARPAAGSSGVIINLYKLPLGILPARFLNVFGMWHMLVIPKAAVHEGAP